MVENSPIPHIVMRKKILCLIDSLGSGGAQRQISNLSCLLSNNGYEIHLAYYYGPNFYSDLLQNKPVNVVKLAINDGKLSRLISVFRCIRRERYNVVIAYMDGPTIICCLLRLFLSNFKLIVSERNATQHISVRDKIKFLLYRLADFIVPNSFSQAKFIEANYPFLKNKIVTIINYVDLELFGPKMLRRQDGIVNILVVGRINIQKNIPNFLKSLFLLKNRGYYFRVKWFGDYNKFLDGKELFEQISKIRDDLNLGDIINFYPAKQNIVEEYQSCDVLCLPSLFEGFSNVICEAMSCGKPILCSNVCDNPLIVQDCINGFLFDPNNPEDMAQVISKFLLLGQADREALSQKSKEIAKSLFSTDSFLKKYIKLIES